MARTRNINGARRSAGLTLRTGLALAVAASVVAGLTACGSSNSAPSAARTTAETPTAPAASALPVSTYAALNQNGGPFSADALSKLYPEQLTALFQIKASEIPSVANERIPSNPAVVAAFGRQYAAVFAQRREAWNNAGCTKTEWAPYENKGKGVFESAIAAIYNAPISKGLFGYEATPEGLKSYLNNCQSMFMDNKTLYNKVDVVDRSVNTTAQNDSVDIVVLFRYTNNFDLRDVLGDNVNYAPGDITYQWTLTGITISAGGVILPSSIDIVRISPELPPAPTGK